MTMESDLPPALYYLLIVHVGLQVLTYGLALLNFALHGTACIPIHAYAMLHVSF